MNGQPVKTYITYDEAFDWLNQFQGPETFMSPFTRQWLEIIDGALGDGRPAQCRELIAELNSQLPAIDTPDTMLDLAETALRCARAYVSMGDYQSALRFLRRALNLYESNLHNQTVTRWLIGCVYWEMPGYYPDALGVWQTAQQTFARLAMRVTVEPAFADWYAERSQEMAEAIEYTINRLPQRSIPPFSTI